MYMDNNDNDNLCTCIRNDGTIYCAFLSILPASAFVVILKYTCCSKNQGPNCEMIKHVIDHAVFILLRQCEKTYIYSLSVIRVAEELYFWLMFCI